MKLHKFSAAIVLLALATNVLALPKINDDFSSYNLSEDYNGFYVISNTDEFLEFAELVNGSESNANAVLLSDIELPQGEWTPMAQSSAFSGTLDGNNHAISGLVCSDETKSKVGLFAKCSGTIKNLGIASGYVAGKSEVAGICAYITGRIENCYNNATIFSKGDYAGGIAAHSYSKSIIVNSHNLGDVAAEGNRVGGILGGSDELVNSSEITNCYNKGQISGKASVGGIVGYIFGKADAAINNCTNAGPVVGSTEVGGIIGYLTTGKVNQCANLGNITGSNKVGGICASMPAFGALNESYNLGNVAGDSNVGGAIGYTETGKANYCFNAGTVTATTNKNAGAFCGGKGITISFPTGYYTTDNNTLNAVGNSSGGKVVTTTLAEITSGKLPEGFDSEKWVAIEGEFPALKNNVGTVILHANGGEIADNISETYLCNVKTALPTQVSRTGYVFKGWFNNPDFEGFVITEISAQSIGTVEFYAKFVPEQYAINYALNGGEIASGNVDSYSYTKATTLPTDVTRTGFNFAGWFSTEDFQGEQILEISETDLGEKTFFAKWTAKQFGVTLNLNGGETDEILTSYTFAQGAMLPTTIIKFGHDFAGWFSTEDFQGEQVFEISETDLGEKTFFAKWTAQEFAITFELNGGELTNSLNSYTFGTEVELPTPTRQGYDFVGWFDVEEDALIEYAGRMFTFISADEIGDKTFYAHWEAQNVSDFDLANGTKVYAQGNKIVVCNATDSVTIYNAIGSKLGEANNTNFHEFTVNTHGLCFVKIGEETFTVVVE